MRYALGSGVTTGLVVARQPEWWPLLVIWMVVAAAAVRQALRVTEPAGRHR